jgi:hypothetical protein
MEIIKKLIAVFAICALAFCPVADASYFFKDGTTIYEADIDTYAELNAIVADQTLTHNGLFDTFAELNAIVADKTLVNEEDAVIFDSNVTASSSLILQNGEFFSNAVDGTVVLEGADHTYFEILADAVSKHAYLRISAGRGDDNGENWEFKNNYASGELQITNDISGSQVEKLGLTTGGILQPSGGYNSTDGTAGATTSCGAATTLTVKNGLITACA